MRALLSVVMLITLVGCASSRGDYETGPWDARLAAEGRVFVQKVKTPDGLLLLRAEAMAHAPLEYVLNMLEDIPAYPTWNALLAEMKVLSWDGQVAEVEATPADLVLRHTVGAMRQHLRVDRERGEVTITVYENALLHHGQTIIKVAADGPDRTIVRMYGNAYPKSEVMEKMGPGAEGTITRAMKGFCSAAPDARWATRPAAPPPVVREKVVILPLKAAPSSLEPDEALGLTRVLAQGMMTSPLFNVVTQEEAAAFVDYARAQELAGCIGEDACGVDVARLLAASRLVQGGVSRVGGVYVVSVTLLSLPDGTVLKRAGRQARDGTELLHLVKDLARELAAP